MKYSSVVLYTGGIDSLITLEYVRQKIDSDTKPVYFYIGSKYSHIEEKIVQETEPDVIIDHGLSLGDIEMDDAYIPQRNVLLATMAVAKFSNNVFIGGSLSDRVSDNNETVMRNLSQVVETAGAFKDYGKKSVYVTSPFWDVYKEDMINWYCGHAEDAYNKLIKTFSCYLPTSSRMTHLIYAGDRGMRRTSECLACKACFRKCAAMFSTGVFIPFENMDIVNKYKMEFEDASLDDRRAMGTLKYIKALENFNGDKGE